MGWEERRGGELWRRCGGDGRGGEGMEEGEEALADLARLVEVAVEHLDLLHHEPTRHGLEHHQRDVERDRHELVADQKVARRLYDEEVEARVVVVAHVPRVLLILP
jgi:phage terminase Nu1 subunit (DNA packaging protein)